MSNKKFWTALLILSVLMFILLCLPAIELYLGLDAPFVTIADRTFIVFGWTIPANDGDRQLGIMLLCGLLLMLPGRLIHLSLMKLANK